MRILLGLYIVAGLILASTSSFALTTENGNATPGSYLGVGDPDEKTPSYLKEPDQQQISPPTGLHVTGGEYHRGLPLFNQNGFSSDQPHIVGPLDSQGR